MTAFLPSPAARAARRGRGHLGAVVGTAIAVACSVCVGVWGPRLGDRTPVASGVPIGGAVAALGRMHRENDLAPARSDASFDWRREVEEALGRPLPASLADPQASGWRAEAILVRRLPAFAGGGDAATVRFSLDRLGGPPRRVSLSLLADEGRLARFDSFGRLRPLAEGQAIALDPADSPESLAVLLWGEGPLVAAVQAEEPADLMAFETAILASPEADDASDDRGASPPANAEPAPAPDASLDADPDPHPESAPAGSSSPHDLDAPPASP